MCERKKKKTTSRSVKSSSLDTDSSMICGVAQRNSNQMVAIVASRSLVASKMRQIKISQIDRQISRQIKTNLRSSLALNHKLREYLPLFLFPPLTPIIISVTDRQTARHTSGRSYPRGPDFLFGMGAGSEELTHSSMNQIDGLTELSFLLALTHSLTFFSCCQVLLLVGSPCIPSILSIELGLVFPSASFSARAFAATAAMVEGGKRRLVVHLFAFDDFFRFFG